MSAFVSATVMRMHGASSWTAKTSGDSPTGPRRVSKSVRPKNRGSTRTARAARPHTKTQQKQRGKVATVARPEPEILAPEKFPALVLNADWQPLSYVPLSLWPWQEVMKAVFLGRVNVVATYDIVIRSPSAQIPLPSVVSLKRYQPPARRHAAFTRFNVFLRDMFKCQYCGCRCSTQSLTFDHVIPRSRGGRTNWENVVSACVACNHAKGRYLLRELKPRFQLRRKPVAPTQMELQRNARNFPPRYLHESWRDYIYWGAPLDEESNEVNNVEEGRWP